MTALLQLGIEVAVMLAAPGMLMLPVLVGLSLEPRRGC